MESWRIVWRKGFAPTLSTKSLVELRAALVADDPCLMQGVTTYPPPRSVDSDPRLVEGGCVICYCGWRAEGLRTVEEVEMFFAEHCFEADHRLGAPASCRWFLNWFDNTTRETLIRELSVEVDLVLAQRAESEQREAVTA